MQKPLLGGEEGLAARSLSLEETLAGAFGAKLGDQDDVTMARSEPGRDEYIDETINDKSLPVETWFTYQKALGNGERCLVLVTYRGNW